MREFLVVLVGRAIAIVLALATLRLSTHFLAPAEYGWLAILQAMQLLAIFFLTNPVAQYLSRHVHEWSAEGGLLPRLRLYLGYVVGCSFLAALAFAAWLQFSGGHARGGLQPVLLIFFGVVALAWGPVLSSSLNFLGHRVVSIVLTAGAALAGLVIAVALSRIEPSADSWFAGTVISTVVMGIFAWGMLRRRLPPVPEIRMTWRADAAAMLRFSGPLAISAIFMWLLLAGYRLEMDYLWGKAELGRTVVGLVVAAQVWAVVEQLALQYLQPYLYSHMNSAGTRDGSLACSDFMNVLGPLYLGYSGLVIVNAPLIYKVLVAEAYHDGLGIFLIAVYIELFRVLGNGFAMAAHVRKDTQSLVKTYALAAIFVVGGVYVAGRFGMGIVAACYILLAGGALMLAGMVFRSRRLVPFEIDWKRWGAGIVVAIASGSVAGLMPEWQVGLGGLVLMALVSALAFLAYVALVLFRNQSLTRLLQRPLSSQVQSN